MNETNPSPTNDLAGQVEALQRQVFVLLLTLLVVSATLAAFLLYESHIFHKDAESIRPQATQLINTFKSERPLAESFVTQLRAYGGTHPDFAAQVLKKYGIPPLTPTNASTPAAPAKK